MRGKARNTRDQRKRKERSKKAKSLEVYTMSCWPKVMISRDTNICVNFNQTSCISSSVPSTNNSKDTTCDVVELLYDENGAQFPEENSTCLITSSTGIQEDPEEVCTAYKDCVECQKRKRIEDGEERNRYDDGFGYSSVNTVASVTEEEPIFVDLTSDEKNIWKQTILKRFCHTDSTDESGGNTLANEDYSSGNVMLEPRIMIADSSSRMHRSGSGSIATALRDRGPCVIPVQPNPSLPIRPAPPTPVRSVRKDRSPLLKLSRVTTLDLVGMEPVKSIAPPANGKINGKVERAAVDKEFSNEPNTPSDYVVPQITSVGSLGGKRKTNDARDHEKETKKRKRSHEPDSSDREDHAEELVKEFPGNYRETETEESGGAGELEVWSEKKNVGAVVVSTTEDPTRDKEGNNKVVPPLRLKKVVRSGIEGYDTLEIRTETEQELNYRIVTGATPRPESRSIPATITSSWDNAGYAIDPTAEVTFENVDTRGTRRSPKTDGHKLKYRRNRLKQMLRELRSKASELAEQMKNPSSTGGASPQRNTTLRQTMNRYEKQIENLSKVLKKLSTTVPSPNEIVDVNDENETDFSEKFASDSNEIDKSTVKILLPVLSPEPPKLSPRSPLDYDEDKLLVDIRNSPPILPRVCLTIPQSRDTIEEDLQISNGKMWSNKESVKITINEDTLMNDSPDRDAGSYSGKTAAISSSIEEPPENVVDVDVGKSDFNESKQSIPMSRSNKVLQSAGNENVSNRERKEKQPGKSKPVENFPPNLMVREPENIECFALPGSANGISGRNVNLVTGDLEVSTSVRNDEIFPSTASTTARVIPSTSTNILQTHTNFYNSTVPRDNPLFTASTDDNRNVQKVTSSSNPSMILNSSTTPATFNQVNPANTVNQERVVLQQNGKAEGTQNDCTQRSDENRIITEQFPTLGNWVARMSKKQASKSRSKFQNVGPTPVTIPGQDMPKMSTMNAGNNVRNNIVNVAPQWNTERWQRQQHQQQRQLLQHVALSVTPTQQLPAAPPLRPSICSPITMAQFYPNSYAIDPYGSAALGYHSAICPYGTYPYHSRLHPGPSLTGYHLPMQDNVNASSRTLQHMDKRFPPLQDHMRHFPTDIMKYPGPLSAGFQHPGNLEYDRLRGTTGGSNTTCVPPLLLPPTAPQSSLSSAQQTLPRIPLTGYPTSNGQFVRNRMIPDVVAAAAAAAVVAAASFDRQRGPLNSFNRPETDTTTATSMTNIDNGAPNANKTAGRDLGNSAQDSFNEENHLNGNYQQLQNLLLDRLTYVRTADNFAQTNSFGYDGQTTTTTSVSTAPYRVSPIVSSRVLSKDPSKTDARNCETPHLGKVDRSPNSLNNLACSNCGVTGSMFKCLGCETAFYCDERCQARHWTVHVEKCPKKMPKLKKVG